MTTGLTAQQLQNRERCAKDPALPVKGGSVGLKAPGHPDTVRAHLGRERCGHPNSQRETEAQAPPCAVRHSLHRAVRQATACHSQSLKKTSSKRKASSRSFSSLLFFKMQPHNERVRSQTIMKHLQTKKILVVKDTFQQRPLTQCWPSIPGTGLRSSHSILMRTPRSSYTNMSPPLQKRRCDPGKPIPTQAAWQQWERKA